MFTTLWTDLAIVVFVSFILGFVIEGGLKGLRLGLTTLAFNLLPLIFLQQLDIGRLPFHHITPPVGKFGPYTASYLVHSYLILEISLVGSLLMGLLGYYTGEMPGAVALQLEALLATLICLAFTLGGFLVFNVYRTTWFLLSAVVVVVPVVLGFVHRLLLSHRTALPLTLLWYEICLSCWIGYQTAGRVGLLLITLPAQVLLGLALLYVARRSLPSGSIGSGPALQSLLAFLLGDNRPYYVIERLGTGIQKDLAPRIPGAGRVSTTDPAMALVFPGYQIFIKDDEEVEIQAHGVHVYTAGERVLGAGCANAQVYTGDVEVETQDEVTLRVRAFAVYRVGADVVGQDAALPDHGVVATKVRKVVQEAFKPWHFTPLEMEEDEEDEEAAPPQLPSLIDAVQAKLEETLTTEGFHVLACGVSGVLLPPERARERESQRVEQHRQALRELELEVERRYEGNLRGEETRFFNSLLEDIAEMLTQAQRSGGETLDKDQLTRDLLTTLGGIPKARPSEESLPANSRSQLLDYYLLTRARREADDTAPESSVGKGERYG